MRTQFIQSLILAVLFLNGVAAANDTPTPTPTEKPNIVFFLLDDLGIKDLGCYGSSFHETPNLDKLTRTQPGLVEEP